MNILIKGIIRTKWFFETLKKKDSYLWFLTIGTLMIFMGALVTLIAVYNGFNVLEALISGGEGINILRTLNEGNIFFALIILMGTLGLSLTVCGVTVFILGATVYILYLLRELYKILDFKIRDWEEELRREVRRG